MLLDDNNNMDATKIDSKRGQKSANTVKHASWTPKL